MDNAKRISAAHVAEILERERALAPELFRDHSDAEKRAIARDRAILDAARDRAALALCVRQLPLSLDC